MECLWVFIFKIGSMILGIVVLVEDFEFICFVMLSDGKINWLVLSLLIKILILLLSFGFLI